MKIVELQEDDIVAAAKQQFPNKFIKVDSSDIYLRGVETGKYQAPWLEKAFYVSTEYVYQDILVKGNQTRYKVPMPTILIKDDAYGVVYDEREAYFAVVMENEQISFVKYVDFIEKVVQDLERIEE